MKKNYFWQYAVCATTCSWLAGSVTGCDAQPRGLVTPTKPTINFPTINKDEQSEPVVVEAETTDGKPVLVVGFIDDSTENIDPPEQSITQDGNEKMVRWGVSAMGWSTSQDGGRTWDYHGKLRGVAEPPFFVGAIVGDPSMAVDPVHKNIVYYAQMAVSTGSFDAANPGKQFADATDLEPDLICIARSMDGGLTFPDLQCMNAAFVEGDGIPEAEFGAEVLDHTAMAVDGGGCLWLIWEDRRVGGFKIRTKFARTPSNNRWC